jgi:hypothetical protein
MDMVNPQLGTSESCLLVSKRKRTLGLRLSKNCLKQSFSNGLRPALALIVVSRAMSLGHVLSQNHHDYQWEQWILKSLFPTFKIQPILNLMSESQSVFQRYIFIQMHGGLLSLNIIP